MDVISKLTAFCLSHKNSFLSFLSKDNRTIIECLSINHGTPKEVHHIIQTLQSNIVVSTDQISITKLKKSPYVMNKALPIIFNKLLFTGIFSGN